MQQARNNPAAALDDAADDGQMPYERLLRRRVFKSRQALMTGAIGLGALLVPLILADCAGQQPPARKDPHDPQGPVILDLTQSRFRALNWTHAAQEERLDASSPQG